MSPDNLVIYHNPACSKSREALQILQDRGLSPRVIEYLSHPPTADELKHIISMLGTSPTNLLRSSEPGYVDAGLGNAGLSDDEIIEAITRHPALLQRPIVVAGDRAVIGRPPSAVLDILA